jgi:hypothetical protein
LTAKFESIADKPVLVVLESVPRARVEGTLLLPDGNPAALRRLSLEHSQLRTLTTMDGQFVFEDARAGEETLSLRDDMTERRVARVEVPAHGVLRLDVRLTGTGSVTGRFPWPPERWDPPVVVLRRKADGERVARVDLPADGRFRIPYLDPGAYVLLIGVIKKGSVRRDVSVASGDVDVGDLALDPAPEVPVVCEIPAGARVAGEVPVRAKGAAAEGWLALGDDGRGFLRALPPGRYRISFTVRDCAPVEADIEIEAVPSQPLVFTLSPR